MLAAWWGPLNEPCCSPHAGQGRRGDDSGGHGRGASEPHGTDGWTPMADCSPISRISRTSTLNRLGGMATPGQGEGERKEAGAGAADRGLGILFLSFRLLSASLALSLLLPASTPLSILKSHFNRSSQFPRFVHKNNGRRDPANYFVPLRV